MQRNDETAGTTSGIMQAVQLAPGYFAPTVSQLTLVQLVLMQQ